MTSLAEERASLPIAAVKDELQRALAENETLVLVGETGSGCVKSIEQLLRR